MSGNRVKWTAPALLTAIVTALVCIGAALAARDGQVFAAALAAGVGIAASTGYTALALRAADRRMAKLSDELTVQAQRLVRLEARAEPAAASAPTAFADDIEALTQATGAIADALDGQDARLRALEQQRETPRRAAPTVEPAARPSQPILPAAPPPPPMPDFSSSDPFFGTSLSTREDFARAASAILDRLTPDPLRLIQAPADDTIVDELEAGRLELWLQPIVTLPQRRTRFYVALPHLRGRDGQPIGPEIIRATLQQRRKLQRLDAFVLSQGLIVASRLAERGSQTGLSIGLSRDSLGNAAFLDGAMARLATDKAGTARLIFEIDAREAEALSIQESGALDRLRALGAGLALADLPTLDQDWTALARRGFGHASLDIETILAPRPHATTAALVADAARAGISLVATGIEREPQVPDLLDFDVPLARGPALAPARPVRADVISPPEPEAAPAPSAAGDGKASFRDFLRRAG